MFEESTKLIDILTFIGSLICICAICHISRTDPFENHIIKNLTDYFNVLMTILTSLMKLRKYQDLHRYVIK